MVYPVRSPFRISSRWGNREIIIHGVKNNKFHDGLDFISEVNADVISILSGKVTYDKDDYNDLARWKDSRQSAGNMVIIDCTVDGILYHVRYLHLLENTIKLGQEIQEGQVIGMYADVGLSTGPHLHLDFCSRLHWAKINPSSIFRRNGLTLV